jgi:hypothetical protein
MFEIGTNLREARRRQGLELDEAVRATLIRARYLEALEQERFDLLPDGFYRRSFLRRYADFLGLDGDAFVDEYELRLASEQLSGDGEPRRHPAPPRLSSGALATGSVKNEARRGERRAPLWLFAALLAAAGLIALGVWQLAPSPAHKPRAAAARKTPAHRRPARHAPARHVAPPKPRPSAPPRATTIELRASRGECWVDVHLGTSSGKALFIGTLKLGQHVSFGLSKPLWIRLGAPGNLSVTIGGRAVKTPIAGAPTDLRATRTGLAAAP